MKVIITETQLRLIKEDYRTSQNEIDLKGDKYGGDVALRKLSYRSKWDFNSKHQGITIEDVMKFFPKSIYWAYTHLEKISFIDEVLDDLAIKFSKTFRKINKPGIDKEQYDEYVSGSNPFEKYTYPEMRDMLNAKRASNEKIDGFFYGAYKDKKHEFQLNQYRAHSGRDEMPASRMTSANQGHEKMNSLKPGNYTYGSDKMDKESSFKKN